MIEAGHRCVIPTCRTVGPLHIDHIDDFVKVQRHDFDNMIVFRANCHGLKGKGPRHLDRKSLRQYKRNLHLAQDRYSDFERRILGYFALDPSRISIQLPPSMEFLILYLLRDEILFPYSGWGDLTVRASYIGGEEELFFSR